ncbi:CAP domain-containing protein [Streptomyces sp. HNM0575]|uniref:CAP domain-containing protein n=1 Tax=Streptomyces sp. HNM0575 TaxID=2716338 RepID=UPI00145CDCE5|nr:CAP domain-containing protein [Streptomyces sp. HNM0575]NLU75054.1 CAP domain-containing protein [Streptomyces sp. HNM0575]
MAMGAVAVASTVLPQPGGAAGTQYSDVQAGGPPDQSSKPNVPAPEGGSDNPVPGDDGSQGGGNVPPNTSPGNQSPAPTQPSEPGGGNDSQQPGTGKGQGGGSGKGSGSGNAQGGGGSDNGSGAGKGTGSGSGKGKGGSDTGESSSEVSQTTRDEARVLSLVNDEREDVGCKPVKASKQLADLAGDFSRDMGIEDFFSHLAPDGSSPWDRAEGLGILDLGGENIARGQETPEDVVDDWMSSPSHRANILNCEYKTMGVGEYVDDDGPWWTQDFGY